MQLTRFDRWLREIFVYEMHIRTMRPPESVPKRIRSVDLPETPGSRFRHLFIARRNQDADALIRQLRENNQMFTSEIVERRNWWTRIVAPADRSISWWLFSAAFMVLGSIVVRFCFQSLADNPQIRDNVGKALDLFKS